jgi:phosphoribosylformylglycinamidine cyclo-ligase
LELPVSEAIIKGIVAGCRQAGTALVGGETAEMPGMYGDGEYDLAGFSVGEVKKSALLDGKKVKAGDALIGLPSSGIHSNGFSLVRKLIKPEETDLLKRALTPTKIYVKNALAALDSKKFGIKGCAHITGSGFYNIPRINGKFGYIVDNVPPIPEIFAILQERAELGAQEMYSTFNMGVGFVVCCEEKKAEALIRFFQKKGERAFRLGHVAKGKGEVKMRANGLHFDLV